ncbi:MAG: hypothetical protein E6581_07070, partial [Cutibacterium granulosum]|nr:hypothetical protein [Cutibacterium granulosum]
ASTQGQPLYSASSPVGARQVDDGGRDGQHPPGSVILPDPGIRIGGSSGPEARGLGAIRGEFLNPGIRAGVVSPTSHSGWGPVVRGPAPGWSLGV